MTMSKSKQAEVVLKHLNGRSPEIEASAVVSRDGLIVASVLKPGIDGGRLGAMCAALLGLSDTAAAELDRGELKLVLVHGQKGVLLLVQAGSEHVLAVSATPEIKLGSLLMEAKKAAASIGDQ